MSWMLGKQKEDIKSEIRGSSVFLLSGATTKRNRAKAIGTKVCAKKPRRDYVRRNG